MTINKHATKHNAQLLDAIHSTNMCPSSIGQDKQTNNTLREYINPSNSPLHFCQEKAVLYQKPICARTSRSITFATPSISETVSISRRGVKEKKQQIIRKRFEVAVWYLLQKGKNKSVPRQNCVYAPANEEKVGY